MKHFASLILFFVLLTTGCASFNKQPVEFQTAADVNISINSDQFDAVELQLADTLLWQNSELVGIITVIDTAPQFQTAIDEVKQGYKANLESSEPTRELDLPAGAYGFASSLRGFTTAFIAVEKSEESWVTISVRDDFFNEILSSVSVD